jgi:hypothetical protein
MGLLHSNNGYWAAASNMFERALHDRSGVEPFGVSAESATEEHKAA